VAPSQPSLEAINLFASKPKRREKAAQEPVVTPPPGAEPGDLFVPDEPVFARETEMQKGKRKNKKPSKTPVANPSPPPSHPNADILRIADDPRIGGKVTICVLLFGNYYDLHRRCLTSILGTVPPSRMDLRVATNQLCLESQNYLRNLPISNIYADTKVRRKYGAMRHMFHDEDNPINTKWVIWFDDDSYVRDPKWLGLLGGMICNAKQDVGMLGVKMMHPLAGRRGRNPRKWFQNASWWRGKDFQTRQGKEAPNGNMIHFIVGGFWALSTEAIRACDIPDTRLNHNGGDICIGEQLHQGGYKLQMFNKDKHLIHTSAAPRRGYHERFLWY
jgi:hypothetical protein